MKLAFCLFKYFPFGGLQRDFLRIARECLARGHEIHVYTMHWEGEVEPGFHLHLLPVRGLQNHTRIKKFVAKVGQALQQENYDKVIGFNKMPHLDVYYAADVCYQARAAQKHGWYYRFLPRYRQLCRYEQAVFDRDSHTEILLIAEQQKKIFQHHYQTPSNRFHLLPPGIARDRKAPADAASRREKLRASLQLQSDDHLVLMVGSGFKTKGVDRAILAMNSLSPTLKAKTHLFIIGQDRADAFIQLAKQLKIDDHIHFLGGRSDVTDFLVAADLLLHPAYHENTGTVLLEALVAGLPVLTLDVCGYAPYIEQANAGQVLPAPFVQRKLNFVLAEMLISPLKAQWKANALAFAENADIYDLPKHAASICEQVSPQKLSFQEYMGLKGECFRNQKGRLTQRIELAGQSYFIKQHHGVGWKEIVKNVLQLRWPVTSAKNEWQAIDKIASLGINVPEVVACGDQGWNPASKKSFVLMRDVTASTSLEELAKEWSSSKPNFALKQQLILQVAQIARTIHHHGINHRDFYLCHFLLPTEAIHATTPFQLTLIDLHRAQMRRLTPTRWIIKDLAGLYFSSKEMHLTKRDLYRFMMAYQQLPLSVVTKDKQEIFWNKVKLRGDRLYQSHSQ